MTTHTPRRHARICKAILLGAMALAITWMARPATAEAGVRVGVKISTPRAKVVARPHHGRVVVKPAPRVVVRAAPLVVRPATVVVRPAPVVVKPALVVAPAVAPLSSREAAIARRIAANTPYSATRIATLRAQGYGWYAIGRQLDIDSAVITACL